MNSCQDDTPATKNDFVRHYVCNFVKSFSSFYSYTSWFLKISTFADIIDALLKSLFL